MEKNESGIFGWKYQQEPVAESKKCAPTTPTIRPKEPWTPLVTRRYARRITRAYLQATKGACGSNCGDDCEGGDCREDESIDCHCYEIPE